MAHRGAARSLLNIFRHSRTPGNYVILSGDVHYSFAYDVEVRDDTRPPHIWQITSSGFKNEFPEDLLNWLDRLNRWLYSPRSPLNWFTKRRAMSITPHLPDQRKHGERGEYSQRSARSGSMRRAGPSASCSTMPMAGLPRSF
jgi:hypothetical protein